MPSSKTDREIVAAGIAKLEDRLRWCQKCQQAWELHNRVKTWQHDWDCPQCELGIIGESWAWWKHCVDTTAIG